MTIKRFFHIRATNPFTILPKGGATIYVEGELSTTEETMVRVSHTVCSQNDAFCRATGRKQAAAHESIAIPLKGLPGYIRKVAKKVLRRTPCYLLDVKTRSQVTLPDYEFSKKYWLEKKPAPKQTAQFVPEADNVSEYLMH